jgi:hypothetical protein
MNCSPRSGCSPATPWLTWAPRQLLPRPRKRSHRMAPVGRPTGDNGCGNGRGGSRTSSVLGSTTEPQASQAPWTAC